MILYPRDYENLELSINKKRLINALRDQLNGDFIAFLEISPIGEGPVFLTLIHPAKGILLIQIEETADQVENYIQLIQPLVWERQQRLLYDRVHSSMSLKKGNGEPSLAIQWIYLFAAANEVQLNASSFVQKHCKFRNDFLTLLSNPLLISNWFDEQNVVLDEEAKRQLCYLLAPHCYVAKAIHSVKGTGISLPVGELQAREIQYLSLSDDQIKYVNDLKPGARLLLACAGSGKSAMLIAKAFRLASLQPKLEVLVTCYNQQLYQNYEWQIDVAGFTERNVKCRTFHGLCNDLLRENGIKNIPIARSEDFDEIFELVKQKFEEGKITTRFDAIFIDEVQIFKKEWLYLLYQLLRSHEEKEYYFIICGDKSQNVNNNISKGEAPWQNQPGGFPDLQSTFMRIERNYRNSEPINRFICSFLEQATYYLDALNLPNSMTNELFMQGRATRDGISPIIIQTDRLHETEKIIEVIRQYHQMGIAWSDIVIIIPQRHYVTRKYYILKWLEDKLNNYDIRFTKLLPESAASINEREGIAISTVESMLGLDFKAVILCGLLPLGQYDEIYLKSHIRSLKTNQAINNEKFQVFLKSMNMIYTGASRARDYLSIVLTEDPQENIYSEIITEAYKRSVTS